MTERDQSPHYIPELDPENGESGPKVKQRILWALCISGLLMVGAGAMLYFAGFATTGLIVAGIGLVLLSPFMFIGN